MAAVAAPPTLDEVERTLSTLVRHANLPRVYERLAARAKVNLDRAAYAALGRIGDEGPLRLSDLAQGLGIDVSTASRQIKQLERIGLVARSGDETDRRCARLFLTGEGRRVFGKFRAARRAAIADLLAEWSAADQAQLATLLGRLVDDMVRYGERARA